MGGNCSWTICVDRFETSFLNKLSTVLNVIGIEYEFQKPVLNNKYKIDCYLNKYNLAIEYDEQQHYVEPQKSKDIKRQKEIETKLKYNFIRLDFKDSDAYNIGIIIKEIIKLNKGDI